MSEILVTVIIPTYKRPQELRRAVLSVLNQDYKKIELIVVDDNFPDSVERKQTEEAMSGFCVYPNVRYIKHDTNKNGAAARNTGIKASLGKYISFLDDDDEYRPHRISRLVEKMESLDHSYGVCYTSFMKYKSPDKYYVGVEKVEGNAFLRALMRNLFLGSGSNLFVRSNIVKEVGGFDETFSRNQDLEFLLRILINYKLAYLDEDLLLIHYERKTSGTTFHQEKKIDEHYRERFKLYIDMLDDDDRRNLDNFFRLNELRYSVTKRAYLNVLRMLFKLNPVLVIRYASHLITRFVKNQACGFDI